MNKMSYVLLVAGVVGLPMATAPAFGEEAAPAAATAPASPHTFTGNVTLASEYIYRGIGQTNRKPAIQGGFDYSHASGFYAGVWGSNISWLSDGHSDVSAPIEIDVYGGYRNTFGGGDWNYDVGVLTYNYPGTYPAGFTSPDTTEVYGLIGWKWLSLKYSNVVSSHIFGFVSTDGGDTRGSGYLDLSANYDLGSGWGVLGHVGHQKIKGFSDASYTDWKVGATKDLGFGVVGLSYWKTNAKSCGDSAPVYCNAFGTDLGKGRALLIFTKTF
jgi:uncharacterized protein (TIGR02001 family)